MSPIDVLAVGAHPDDAEIGMGGTLAKLADQGYRTALICLTKAELSSNGTVEERQKEAANAAKVLGAERMQLAFPDRQLSVYRPDCIAALVKVVREYRPKIVFAPNKEDRHPDHGHCSEIVKEAVFSAGIRRYLPESGTAAYRPTALYYYQINGVIKPDFVVDISGYVEQKRKALSCYKSQFNKNEQSAATPLNTGYLQAVEGRERLLGNEAGVTYAEGFLSDRPLLMSNLIGE
ncbi:bacillithiol biosynthesis deacetylase BshB1 [Evansella caseinilytica]|uniref:Bacillithiol biosynthesis deacetylase BshB1 n=1 Tax=Evansella caseinilytica TaxID=1503961 RepID=A0A1H3NHW5_9BACI|nr:bacillithiol biosynthesis deacetylase BshB1 [Evansella caseinilytica]SDY88045.1 bacillithiol biosynthesis deacetylase BshB1 [Evansella caseinilytica]